jgi:hypothetical protein
MNKVKLSTLSLDAKILVDGSDRVINVEDVVNDLDFYKNKELYTTTEIKASFDAESILNDAIENEACNGMYEDWDESIKGDVKDEDIAEIQAVLDRILERSPEANIAYESDQLIEIDIV